MRKIFLILILFVSVFAADSVVKLNITGMTCPMCVKSVKNAISGVKGVKNAKVYLKDGKAEVLCDDGTKTADIVDAIKQQGFGAEVIK